MNVIHFNEKACERIRIYFDSYLDNELLVETNHEVLRHLSVCAECTKLLEARAVLKRTVKRAVQQEQAPAALLESIQRGIRRRRLPFDLGLRQWAIVAAAIAIFVAGGLIGIRTGKIFSPAGVSDAFQLLSLQAQQLMRVGLVDHLHCAVLIGKWKEFLSFEHMKEETGRAALGQEFIGLVPLVTEKVGANLHVVQGHRCIANGREYVHIILTGDKGTILSLVITEKNGEDFTRAGIVAALQESGVPVYDAAEGRLQIAGFETNRYLAYVVSNLDREGNLKVASSLALPVYEYLLRLG